MPNINEPWTKNVQELWAEYQTCAETLKDALGLVSGINSPVHHVSDDMLSLAQHRLGEVEGACYRMRMIVSQLSTYPIQFRYPLAPVSQGSRA